MRNTCTIEYLYWSQNYTKYAIYYFIFSYNSETPDLNLSSWSIYALWAVVKETPTFLIFNIQYYYSSDMNLFVNWLFICILS